MSRIPLELVAAWVAGACVCTLLLSHLIAVDALNLTCACLTCVSVLARSLSYTASLRSRRCVTPTSAICARPSSALACAPPRQPQSDSRCKPALLRLQPCCIPSWLCCCCAHLPLLNPLCGRVTIRAAPDASGRGDASARDEKKERPDRKAEEKTKRTDSQKTGGKGAHNAAVAAAAAAAAVAAAAAAAGDDSDPPEEKKSARQKLPSITDKGHHDDSSDVEVSLIDSQSV